MRAPSATVKLLGVLLLGVPVPVAAQSFGLDAGGPMVWIWVSLLVLAVAAAAAGFVLFRRRGDDGYESDGPDVPPLLFPAAPASHPRRIRPAAVRPAMPLAHAAAAATAAPERVRPPAPVSVSAGDSLVDGQTIRFHKPTDGTLQILPGRLEIVAGADRGQSIRFVRTGGNSELTFGRSEGPPYRHVQLRAPTVSRRHAQMQFDSGGWQIRNLSQTNPVVVNGQELVAEGAPRPLQEGDRIEMGEIAFVFRER